MPLSKPSERTRLSEVRRKNLVRRAQAMQILREFFIQHDFLEVETPLLVPSPGLEVHLDAFAVEQRYLITSPEYQLKRLLTAGLERIYAVAKCFRRGEVGAHHNPEFTMVEWYRAPGTWREIARDVENLCAAVVRAVCGATQLIYQGEALDLTPPWPMMTVSEAMEKWAGVRLAGDETLEVLRERIQAAGHKVGEGSWDDVFFAVFLDWVEPQLGRGRPTVLYDWPLALSALARRSPTNPKVVERFEAYAGGLELCNGFGELTDAVEQRARFEHDRGERRRRGLPDYPIDECFLAALEEGMPDSAGVALGIDRLIMIACNAGSLRDVVSFFSDEL